jgi:cytochrome P450
MQEKMKTEIDQIFDQNPATPLIENLSKFIYCKNFISETLRLRPPVPFTTRIACEDCELGGIKIPKGSEIYIYFHNVHLSAKHWVKPLDFFPERFNNVETKARHSYCYIPFLGGDRNCIGQKLGEQEILIYLIHLVKNFRLECQEIDAVGDSLQATWNPDVFNIKFTPLLVK